MNNVMTIDGKLLKVGDTVKVCGGTTKIDGLVGRVIQRRNRKTDFVTHRASPLGHLWIKFGRRKDNTEKIVPILPELLKFWKKVKKRGGGRGKESIDMNAIMEDINFEEISFGDM